MYKNLLPSVFLTLLLLAFLTACRGINIAAHHRAIPVFAPTHPAPTVKSIPLMPDLKSEPASKSAPIEGYLSIDDQRLIWIQWKEDATGNMQGTLHSVYYKAQNNTLKYFDAPFTGTHNGESIDFNVRYSFLITVSEPGTLKEGVLHITPRAGAKTIDAYGTSTATYEKYLKQLQMKQSSTLTTSAS